MIIKFVVLFFPLFCFINYLFAQSSRTFGLNDSIFYAMKNNQQILVANEDVEIAKARIMETRALNFPKIDFNFNASQYETMSPFMLSDYLGSVYYPKKGGLSSNYAARFSILQYLYAGGRYTSNFKLAKTNLQASEANRDIVVAMVKYEVKKVYYNLLYAKEKYRLWDDEIKAIAKQKVPRYNDWVVELNRERYNAKILLEIARLNFLSKLGIELNTDFDVTGSIEIELKSFDINKLFAISYQYRKELNAVAIQETIDSLSVSLLQTEKYPTITLGGTYELPEINLSKGTKNWAVYINLNLPIFDGWASWARLSAKKSHLKQSGLRKTIIDDTIALDVRRSYLAYEVSKEKLKFDSENLERFIAQGADRKKIFAAKNNLLESKLDVALSYIQLEKAVGKEL